MNKRVYIFILVFTLGILPLFNIFGQSSDGQTLDGELYVKLKDHIYIKQDLDSKEAPAQYVKYCKDFLSEFGFQKLEASFHFAQEDQLRRIFRIYFSENDKKEELIRKLQGLNIVEYAEPVPLLLKSLTPNDLGGNSTTGTGQWNLHKIRAQQAWDISTGSLDIKVGVVDDAVLVTHPDLAPNCVAGRDVSNNTNNPNPPNNNFSHGTHVAGTVSAKTNNGLGIASIGFNIKILPVKSSNSSTSISHGYEGVTWASNNGADVINMSWGGTFGGQTGANVVNAAFNNGVTLVAAAGNNGVTTVFYPAGYNNVISVAATQSNDQKASFSNYGNWIDISSPGTAIRSTIVGNSYGNMQGTSMASPLVAGLCGLILSVNPLLTPTQVKACLQSSADNINQQNPSLIGRLGAGRINAENALICASATTVPFDAGINAISAPSGSYCTNNISPIVTLKNFGTNTLTAITISYQLNNGLAQTFDWTGSLVSQATTQVTLPTITIPNGNNTFSATTTGQLNGSENDAFLNNNASATAFTIVSPIGAQLPFTEDFESPDFSLNQWTVENPDNWLTWEVIEVGGNGPGSQSARLPFYSYSATGQRDGLITRTLDFSGYTEITMSFKHAYRRFNTASSDSLIIYISTDCGVSWPNRVFARGENTTGIFATAFTSTSDFIPENSDVWCGNNIVGSECYEIDLSSFAGNSSVRVKFESYNNYGNNLYIDDINISGISAGIAPVAEFSASGGASVCAEGQITFTNQSTNAPQDYLWTFEGGTPATSTAINPSVIYNTPGIYSVRLNASNNIGSDEIIKNNYITVHPRPAIIATAEPSQICAGSTANLSATGANTYTWFPVAGLTQGNTGANIEAKPSNNITYTVNGVSSQGCIGTSQVSVSIIPAPTPPSISFNIQEGALTTSNTDAISYQWYLNGVAIQGANSPTHTPLQNGIYYLEIMSDNGCIAKSSSINVLSTSILNALNDEKITLFPNPNDGRFTLKVGKNASTYMVDVFNILGARMIAQRQIQNNDAENQFDFSYLPKGVYLIRISTPKGYAETIRFTKM